MIVIIWASPPPPYKPTAQYRGGGGRVLRGCRRLPTSLYILPGSRPKPLRPLSPHKATARKRYRNKNYYYICNGKEVLFMLSEIEKQEAVNKARDLTKWFKIEIRISIFRQTIFSWTWPPAKDD